MELVRLRRDGAVFQAMPFLFVLTIVVFIHEMGHFLVARWCGVKVKAFSVGFGPEMFGFYDRNGTRWRLRRMPLGGYVKFLDDENAASVTDRSALAAMTPRRSASAASQARRSAPAPSIVAAGPIANFMLAIVIFTVIYTVMGVRCAAAAGRRAGRAGGAAKRAGFQAGDVDRQDRRPGGRGLRRHAAGGQRQRRQGAELRGVNRGGGPVTLKATPARRELVNQLRNKMRVGQIGIRRNAHPARVGIPALGSAPSGERVRSGRKGNGLVHHHAYPAVSCRSWCWGAKSTDQLRGADRHRRDLGQVATLGIMPLLNLVALISVSIGLINLFPIPLLDGGHLLFYAIEAVRREAF